MQLMLLSKKYELLIENEPGSQQNPLKNFKAHRFLVQSGNVLPPDFLISCRFIRAFEEARKGPLFTI